MVGLEQGLLDRTDPSALNLSRGAHALKEASHGPKSPWRILSLGGLISPVDGRYDPADVIKSQAL